MRKYDPIIKQVHILRKLCTINRLPSVRKFMLNVKLLLVFSDTWINIWTFLVKIGSWSVVSQKSERKQEKLGRVWGRNLFGLSKPTTDRVLHVILWSGNTLLHFLKVQKCQHRQCYQALCADNCQS